MTPVTPAKPKAIKTPKPPSLFAILEAKSEEVDDLPIPDSPYYVIDQKGFLVMKKTRLGRVLARLDSPPTSLPKYDFSGFLWPDIPKIDAELLGQVALFFKDVYTNIHAEAMVLLCINDKNEYSAYVPSQEVDYSSIDYKFDPSDVPQDVTLIGTIHSHCDFSAFHSHTDEGDAAKRDGLHITFGKVNSEALEIDVMVSFNGINWKNYKTEDITDAQEIKYANYPIEWLAQATLPPPKPMVYTPPKTPNASGYGYGDYGTYKGNANNWQNKNDTEKMVQRVLANRGPAGPVNTKWDYDDDNTLATWPMDDYSDDPIQFMREISTDLAVLTNIAKLHGYRLKTNLKVNRAYMAKMQEENVKPAAIPWEKPAAGTRAVDSNNKIFCLDCKNWVSKWAYHQCPAPGGEWKKANTEEKRPAVQMPSQHAKDTFFCAKCKTSFPISNKPHQHNPEKGLDLLPF